MKLSQIKTAVKENQKMVWNDPDPIEGNDYNITFVEDLRKYEGFTDEEMEDAPIFIKYGGGSEAEVFPWEISLA